MSKTAMKTAPTDMTVPKLANVLGIDAVRLYRMVRKGYVRTQRLSQRLVVPAEEADRLINSARTVASVKGNRVLFADMETERI